MEVAFNIQGFMGKRIFEALWLELGLKSLFWKLEETIQAIFFSEERTTW